MRTTRWEIGCGSVIGALVFVPLLLGAAAYAIHLGWLLAGGHL